MAFKLKAPYHINNTPIYNVPDDDNVNGRANKNGTITLNPENMDSPEQELNTISHEMTHVKQFKDFEKTHYTGKSIIINNISLVIVSLPL